MLTLKHDDTKWPLLCDFSPEGDVAQMVERSLSMWEVRGSIPRVSKTFFLNFRPSTPRSIPCTLADDVLRLAECRRRKKDLHRPGIEPGPPAWQASILPLNQRCWLEKKQYTSAGECPCSNVRFVLNVTKPKIMSRSRQDSNLRSQRETDF